MLCNGDMNFIDFKCYGSTFKTANKKCSKVITLKPGRETSTYENVLPKSFETLCTKCAGSNKIITAKLVHNIIIESSFNAREYQINFTGFKLIRYA